MAMFTLIKHKSRANVSICFNVYSEKILKKNIRLKSKMNKTMTICIVCVRLYKPKEENILVLRSVVSRSNNLKFTRRTSE